MNHLYVDDPLQRLQFVLALTAALILRNPHGIAIGCADSEVAANDGDGSDSAGDQRQLVASEVHGHVAHVTNEIHGAANRGDAWKVMMALGQVTRELGNS